MDWSQIFGPEWISIILVSAFLFAIAEITEKKLWGKVGLYFLYWTWCFPQTFLGFLWFIICKIRGFKTSYFNDILWTGDPNYSPAGGVSLGMFIFGRDNYVDAIYCPITAKIKRHEYGHSKQSLMLGWLYLIVIALPSLIWLSIYKRTGKDYYWFYTELWADKLGNVERGE